MSMLPARSELNTIFVPSGDHDGSVSTNVSSVSRAGVPPSDIVQMSPSAANVSCLPSGDMTGWMMPFTGCGAVESKSRVFRVYDGGDTCSVAVKSIGAAAPPLIERRLMRPSAV